MGSEIFTLDLAFSVSQTSDQRRLLIYLIIEQANNDVRSQKNSVDGKRMLRYCYEFQEMWFVGVLTDIIKNIDEYLFEESTRVEYSQCAFLFRSVLSINSDYLRTHYLKLANQ